MSRTASDPSNSDKSPISHDLAQRLLAYESAAKAEEATTPPLFRVCETLRRPLSALAGTIAFRTLLERALALAKARAPGLGAVQVKDDGSLQGLSGPPNNQAADGVVLIASLLGLLSAFIGEAMMLRLVLDAWPGLSANDLEFLKGREA